MDEPGHAGGHLFLANYHLNFRTAILSEARANVESAMVHVEYCLIQDPANLGAMAIQAKILFLKREYASAYEVYERLSAHDPKYFHAMVDINKRLGRPERNLALNDKAIEMFEELLEESQRGSNPDRVIAWQGLTRYYLSKKDFDTIEARLLEEIELLEETLGENGDFVWAEQLLAAVYLSHMAEYPDKTVESLKTKLDLAEKAYVLYPKNEFVLRHLARLGGHENKEIATEARRIYDPTSDKDAPALVLNELGAQAMGRKDYRQAIRYFELGRKKSPKSPEILNNLSYTYLQGDSPNPKRGLKLVDQAILLLPKTGEYEKYRTHFHETRGKALMLLDRMPEAIEEFKNALRARPENEKILASLIECCKAAEVDSAAYEKRLRELQEHGPKEKYQF